MFDFDFASLLGKQIDTLRPHAMRAGNMAAEYADAVVCRLDRAIDLLDEISGDTTSTRYWFTQGATVGQANDKPLFTVPANEVWVLEHVMVWGTNGNANHRLWDVSTPAQLANTVNPTTATAAVDMLPLWGYNNPNAGANSVGGNGLRFKPGTDVYYSCHTTTTGSGSIRVQVKRIKLKSRSKLRTFAASFTPPKQTNAETIESTEVTRHTGTWTAGRSDAPVNPDRAPGPFGTFS